MALAPRSSLRSLMPLMSHGKPRLSSFFSSSAVATGVPPAAPGAIDTPPAVQPPAPPGRSCPKLPVEEFVHHPIPGGPRSRPHPRHPVPDPSTMAVTNEPARCTREHPKYPIPDSSSDKVSFCSSAVPPQAAGTYSTPSAPDVQPPALPDRSSRKLPVPEEAVIHPVPDP
ncbi:splicing factor 3A subunit 2-like isoform X2 [Hordeum vulgare subsp. vulgare]|uniref:splicing factor 3A subunit 2-like isoform X2 n=1 Tax=Hordeum vulgare subsp. vulgare TaxID=112509 RepID=UPI001D1A414C|nr:splicing factor 3A subunit 2-like isoform X2 [Hordeum vulgare subsp. vulgare]